MLKKLDHNNFVEELKKFKKTKISFLPSEYDDTYFRINYPWLNPNKLQENEKKLQDFLYLKSLTLKKNEIEFYINVEKFIIGINSDFIILTNGNNKTSVLTTKSDYLYNFGYNHFYDFDINSKTFNFSINEDTGKKNIKLLFNFDDYHKHMKDIEFSIKKKDIIFITSNMGLTSIQFKDSDIITTFKGTSYSNMVLDYDFNIKSVEINKKLKKTLEIDNILTYTDIKDYSDLMSKIKESLKDEFDFLSVTKDLNIKFKDSENKFNRDIEFIKKITNNKVQLLDILSSNQNELINFYDYYSNYNSFKYFKTRETTLRYRIEILKERLHLSEYEFNHNVYLDQVTFDNYLHILCFFTINEETNNNFMNSEILNKYKKLNDEIQDVLSFNNEILSFIKPLRKVR